MFLLSFWFCFFFWVFVWSSIKLFEVRSTVIFWKVFIVSLSVYVYLFICVRFVFLPHRQFIIFPMKNAHAFGMEPSHGIFVCTQQSYAEVAESVTKIVILFVNGIVCVTRTRCPLHHSHSHSHSHSHLHAHWPQCEKLWSICGHPKNVFVSIKIKISINSRHTLTHHNEISKLNMRPKSTFKIVSNNGVCVLFFWYVS